MTLFTIRNQDDIRDIEKIPLAERLIAQNTYQLIQHTAQTYPDKIAISYIASGIDYTQHGSISYQKFLQQIHQYANLFYALGIRSNDVISYLLPNLPQTHFVLWGAQVTGIVNPINPLLEADTIKCICQTAHTKILVALGNTDIWQKVLAIQQDIPSLRYVLCLDANFTEQGHLLNLQQHIDKQPTQLTFQRDIAPEDIASLYHTGGTTGTPKLAQRSHYNEIAMAWMINTVAGLHSDTTLLCGLPLFHVNATMITGLSVFASAAKVVLLTPTGFRNPDIIQYFYAIVHYYQANFFSAVPTVLSALLEVPVKHDISSLEYAVCGAAPLSVELFRRFEQHTKIRILEGYGLTEGTCASAVNPKDGERKIGSIGLSMPYQSMQIAILDKDTGAWQGVAKPNEIGYILIKGDNVFQKYLDPQHNETAWLKDGWFITGDLGRQDQDGYFWLTGRIKELIIRGGHNIDPLMIEEIFYQLPEVKLAAAIACPHPHLGEVPVVFVELTNKCSLNCEDLLQYVTQHTAEQAAIPKKIFIIDHIPLTPIGKIFKPALRWQITKEVYQQALHHIPFQSIKVCEDKQHGTRVNIYLPNRDKKSLTKQIKQRLSDYTLYYQLHFLD